MLNGFFNKVFGQLGFGSVEREEWKFHKYVKEAAFGPGLPVNTVFIAGKLVAEDTDLQGLLVFQICRIDIACCYFDCRNV